MNVKEYARTTVGDVAGIDGNPDAIEAASIRHRSGLSIDPAAVRARGVEWVRPTDLMVRGGSRVAGAGIDFQRELARRARTATTERMHAVGDHARRLPPLSAFGRGGTDRGVERSAVGMR